MSQKASLEVLIVGAGPTGLTAAAELARLGVSVRIVEKNAARSDKSKALGVAAGGFKEESSPLFRRPVLHERKSNAEVSKLISIDADIRFRL